MALILSYRGAKTGLGSSAGVDVGLSDADIVLGDFDVLPWQLADSGQGADHLNIVDPLSFPFEDLSADGWNSPLTVHLPELDFGRLVALLDEPLLSKLTVVDSVLTSEELWSRLQPYYGWPRSMRLRHDAIDQRSCIESVERAAALLDGLDHNPYSGWALRSGSNKRSVVAIGGAIQRCIAEAIKDLRRQPRVELHGCWVQPYIPVVWQGLATVFEHQPAGRARLQHQYRRPRFALPSLKKSAEQQRGAGDVVVGVGLHELGRDAAQQAYRAMFLNARVGGMLVVAERFAAGRGPAALTPNSLIECLLDASGNNLVLDRVEPIATANDEPLNYAVMAVTKLGETNGL